MEQRNRIWTGFLMGIGFWLGTVALYSIGVAVALVISLVLMLFGVGLMAGAS